MHLVRTEQELAELRRENLSLNQMFELERNRTKTLEKVNIDKESEIQTLRRKLHEHERKIEEQKTQINQKESKIKQMEIEQQQIKQRYQSKYAMEVEKTSQKLEKKFKDQTEAMNVSVQ